MAKFFTIYKTPIIIGGLLTLYSLLNTSLTGFMGFHGDTWQIIYLSYGKNLFESIASVTQDFRPVESLFWIAEFKLIGFNSIFAHLISQILHVLQTTLFGLVIMTWSRNPLLTAFTMAMAFFHPAVSQLTYIIHTDNSRLAGIFFWLSLFLYQRNASRLKTSLFIAAGISYLVSFFSYENYSLAILAMPSLIYPIKNLKSFTLTKKKNILLHLGISLLLVILAVILRNIFLEGGAVKSAPINSVVLVQNVIGYFLSAVGYSYQSFHLPTIPETVILIICLAISIYIFKNRQRLFSPKTTPLWIALITSLVIFTLGIAPYILAGYGMPQGNLSGSRPLSAGIFGYSLLLAAPIVLFNRKVLGTLIVTTLILILISYISNHLSRIEYWRLAARQQKYLLNSLLFEVPSVTANSNFLFIDSQIYLENMAVVMESSQGTRVLPRIIYADDSLNGFFGYSRKNQNESKKELYTNISPNGVTPRASSQVYPLDSFIILKKNDRKFEMVPSIERDNQEYLANWEGDILSFSNQPQRIIKTLETQKFQYNYINNLPD